MENFLKILQKLTGTGGENRIYHTRENPSSSTGVDTAEGTAGLIDSFKYPSKDQQRKAGKQMMEGISSFTIYNPGSNTAEDENNLTTNRPEYVPFVYTTTSNRNEPLKYGYILRYGEDSDPNMVYGVTTDTRDYTADGAKSFFDKIKNNGGMVRLYSKPEEYHESSLYKENFGKPQLLEDVQRADWYGSGKNSLGNGGSGTYGYSGSGLIEAMREANRQNRRR